MNKNKKESNEESDDSTSKASSKTGKDFEIFVLLKFGSCGFKSNVIGVNL